MKNPNDVRLPPIWNRSLTRWVLGTAVAFVGVAVHVFVTDSVNRPTVIPMSLLMALFVAALAWKSIWVDPVEGALTIERFRAYHRRILLRPGTQLALTTTGSAKVLNPSRKADVLLRVRPPGVRRYLYVQLLRIDIYVEKSLDPTLLRLLADTLDQHIGHETREIADTLRAQAAHGEADGDARSSPLMSSPLVISGLPFRDPPPAQGPGGTAERRR